MELELRLILLAIGIVIIGLIYAWGMRKNIKEGLERRRRLKKQRSNKTLTDAMPAVGEPGSQSEQPASDNINILDEFEVRVIDRTAQYREKAAYQEPPEWAKSPAKKPAELADPAVRNEDGIVEDPVPAEASLEEPGLEEPRTEEPGLEEPGLEEPRIEEPNQEKPAGGQPGMTVLLTVLAPSGQSFSGTAIRKVAKELALPLGEQGVLECNTDTETGKRTKTVFSIAHLREPGIFDADTFDTLTTPGLLLFLSLPGPLSATEAVRMMFGVAGQLAEKLGGTVCDEKRRRFTRDAYVELHRRASQFEQQTMSEA